jgi:hypothetical protein
VGPAATVRWSAAVHALTSSAAWRAAKSSGITGGRGEIFRPGIHQITPVL